MTIISQLVNGRSIRSPRFLVLLISIRQSDYPEPEVSRAKEAACSSKMVSFDGSLVPLSVRNPIAASASFWLYGSSFRFRTLMSVSHGR